jgi:phosphoribosylformylglycinamidine synthase subunit PurQ / glutaminase
MMKCVALEFGASASLLSRVAVITEIPNHGTASAVNSWRQATTCTKDRYSCAWEAFRMKAAIIIFPGTNRERDMAMALQRGTGQAPRLVWHKDTALDGFDLVVLPGGFSHGDYLRSGAMAARSPIMQAVRHHAERGGYVLGVCNGFQILTEAEILPGALLRNASLRFLSQDCHLRVERTDTAFTRDFQPSQVFRAPMAHGDGNYCADPAVLDRLEAERRVAFRYATADGGITADANPNGSARNIAGVFSANLRVLGLMPHPENLVDRLTGGEDGLPMFSSLAQWVAA